MYHTLAHSILDTLSFFDIFSYPLTPTEVRNQLWQAPDEVTSEAVSTTLAQLAAVGLIQESHGLYSLGDVTVAATRRQNALWEVEEKLRPARGVSRWLRFVPFVRAIFICNTVAFGWPRPESDIDVLIVVRHGRLWLTRFLVTTVVSLLGKRRHGRYISNRICLSFYLVDTALNLGKTTLPGGDIYLAYWVAHLHPLFDSGGLARAMHTANPWARANLRQMPLDDQMHPDGAVQPTRRSQFIQTKGEKILSGRIGNQLETWTRRSQQWKMARNKNSLQNEPDTRVVISDEMLKFHENDRRALYRAEWEKRRLAARAQLAALL